MPAEERNAQASRPEGGEAREHSLGVLARGLADGTVSRKQALKCGGSVLLGGVLASIPEVALANDKKTGHGGAGRRPAGERGQIAVYGSSPLVGTPLNMTVDEDRRFWWTDVTTKGLGSIEPLSADPESTVRRIDLPNGSLPM